MKKVLFNFASLLVLTACGQEERKKREEEQ